MPGGLPPAHRHPLSDRVVRLVHAVVGAAVDDDGSLTRWRFGCIHLARGFKCARNLDARSRTVSARPAALGGGRRKCCGRLSANRAGYE
jgi:hypothetical protein